jgi:hypothetical protein
MERCFSSGMAAVGADAAESRVSAVRNAKTVFGMRDALFRAACVLAKGTFARLESSFL